MKLFKMKPVTMTGQGSSTGLLIPASLPAPILNSVTVMRVLPTAISLLAPSRRTLPLRACLSQCGTTTRLVHVGSESILHVIFSFTFALFVCSTTQPFHMPAAVLNGFYNILLRQNPNFRNYTITVTNAPLPRSVENEVN